MAVDVAPGSLELADSFRCGRGTASPIQLWRAANEEANGSRSVRIEHYRHAMIHAGYLETAKGGPYKRCPVCYGLLR